MKRILPTWCKEVKKSMIDDDINVTELAERVGFSRNYVSGVVNGRVYAPEIAKVIGEDRHVTVPYTDTRRQSRPQKKRQRQRSLWSRNQSMPWKVPGLRIPS